MRRTIKKALSALLSAAMAVTLGGVESLSGGGVAADAAEKPNFTASTQTPAAEAETLTGTAWWDAGNQRTKDYTLSGDGNLDLYVGYTAAVAAADPAFTVELVSDGNKYITTGSDINIWTAEGATADTVEGATLGGTIELGHLYKISILRLGADFTITYFDVTGNKEHCTLKAIGTNMGADVSVHVIAQVGTFMAGPSQFEMPEAQPSTEPTQIPTQTPAPNDTELDCGGFWSAHTKGYKVTQDGVSIEFNSTSNESATNNWEAPLLVIYEGDEGVVGGAGYKEYAVMRSDNWAWGPEGVGDKGTQGWYNAGYRWVERGVPNDWTRWIDSNKAGVKAVASAVIKDGKIIVKFSIDGSSYYLTIPVSTDKDIYLSLSGENCKLADIHEVEYKKINVPGTIAPYPVDIATPTPAPSLPPAADGEEGSGLELDCNEFWSAHSSGIEVTESGVAISFRNTSHAQAASNWETPIVIGYAGDEGVVNGAGYKEYVVVRSDLYAWSPTTNSNEAAAWEASGYKMIKQFPDGLDTPDSWSSWLSRNKSGVDCKVQAIRVGNTIVIELVNDNAASWTSFTAADGEKIFISLSGEQCKLTDIKSVKYEGIKNSEIMPSGELGTAPGTEPSPVPSAAPSATPSAAPSNPNGSGSNGENVQNPGGDAEDDEGENREEEKNKKKTIKISGIKAKAGTKKITGSVSVKGASVKVKIGGGKYKSASVKGKKFTFKTPKKLKKGDRIAIKATKSKYKKTVKKVDVK